MYGVAYYFSYDTTTGRVTWDDSLESAAFRRDGIPLWDYPERFLFPYRSIVALFGAMSSDRWWVRLHAIHSIGFLLDLRWSPCHGLPTGQIGPKLKSASALQPAAATHRQQALNLVIDRLTDRDPEVVAAADSALETVTRQTIPLNAHAQREWRRWVARASCDH